ncbi:hypothetical protein F5882DRAFT_381954 [Hyaloscypha sp. PMI_1271]|nr:hypothetical protein F5882DRAFT_381954 [Hyaloscypha sp. PMI_1271]
MAWSSDVAAIDPSRAILRDRPHFTSCILSQFRELLIESIEAEFPQIRVTPLPFHNIHASTLNITSQPRPSQTHPLKLALSPQPNPCQIKLLQPSPSPSAFLSSPYPRTVLYPPQSPRGMIIRLSLIPDNQVISDFINEKTPRLIHPGNLLRRPGDCSTTVARLHFGVGWHSRSVERVAHRWLRRACGGGPGSWEIGVAFRRGAANATAWAWAWASWGWGLNRHRAGG